MKKSGVEFSVPVKVTLHKRSRYLELAYDNGAKFELPFEFLRVYSPSAEVRGHSPEDAIVQTGKKAVDITKLEPIGNYALKLVFDDGHDSGLFSWEYLSELGDNQKNLWNSYLQRLDEVGGSRER